MRLDDNTIYSEGWRRFVPSEFGALFAKCLDSTVLTSSLEEFRNHVDCSRLVQCLLQPVPLSSTDELEFAPVMNLVPYQVFVKILLFVLDYHHSIPDDLLLRLFSALDGSGFLEGNSERESLKLHFLTKMERRRLCRPGSNSTSYSRSLVVRLSEQYHFEVLSSPCSNLGFDSPTPSSKVEAVPQCPSNMTDSEKSEYARFLSLSENLCVDEKLRFIFESDEVHQTSGVVFSELLCDWFPGTIEENHLLYVFERLAKLSLFTSHLWISMLLSRVTAAWLTGMHQPLSRGTTAALLAAVAVWPKCVLDAFVVPILTQSKSPGSHIDTLVSIINVLPTSSLMDALGLVLQKCNQDADALSEDVYPVVSLLLSKMETVDEQVLHNVISLLLSTQESHRGCLARSKLALQLVRKFNQVMSSCRNDILCIVQNDATFLKSSLLTSLHQLPVVYKI